MLGCTILFDTLTAFSKASICWRHASTKTAVLPYMDLYGNLLPTSMAIHSERSVLTRNTTWFKTNVCLVSAPSLRQHEKTNNKSITMKYIWALRQQGNMAK